VTNLVEMIRIKNKSMLHVSEQFENAWLSHYPRPNNCIYDNGTEFTGWMFRDLLDCLDIKPHPITVKNPQSNAICERMHQTVANVLRVLLHAHPPQNVADADQLVDNSLATAVHVSRCAVSRSPGLTPGEMVFRRDMIMDVPILVDLAVLHDKRQGLVDEATHRENAKRFDFNYTVRQEVNVKEHNPDKLQPRAIGPFQITQVFTNGTVEIQIKPHVEKQFNIQRLIPKQ
jgi:hypothetical protein